MTQKWVALFSQTGSEIARLAETFGRWPDQILTDNFDDEVWSKNIDVNKVTAMNPAALHNGLRNTKEKLFITLHGYLKIIPSDLCEMHDIYNGHPGAINLYPELKGRDPQEMVWKTPGLYEYIGSVVHKVTAGVDEGEIVGYIYTDNDCQTKEELYNVLKDCSYEAWLDFLRDNYFYKEEADEERNKEQLSEQN